MINARHAQQLRDMGASEETIERPAREARERLAVDAEAFVGRFAALPHPQPADRPSSDNPSRPTEPA